MNNLLLDERAVFSVGDHFKIAFAGATTCCVTHGFFIHIADVIAMNYPRLKMNGYIRGGRYLLSEGGLWYLTRGIWAPTAVGHALTGLSRFGLYECFRAEEYKRKQEQWFFQRLSVAAIVAAFAESVAVILSYPFERLRFVALGGKNGAVRAFDHPFKWREKNERFSWKARVSHYKYLFLDSQLGGHPSMAPQCLGVAMLVHRVPAIAVQFAVGKECQTLIERRTGFDPFGPLGSEMSWIRVRNVLVAGSVGGIVEGLFYEGVLLRVLRKQAYPMSRAVLLTNLKNAALYRGACAACQWAMFDCLKWSISPF